MPVKTEITAAYIKYNKVEHQNYNSRRQLLDERRKAEGKVDAHNTRVRLNFYKLEIIFSAHKVYAGHADAYYGSKPRGKNCAEHSHFAGEYKYR